MSEGHVDPTEKLVVELSDALDELDAAKSRIDTVVRAARDGGLSWSDIGRVLGVTRQAAWERFHGL